MITFAVRDAKAVRWTHSCIGANNVTIVTPCTTIAGTSKYQNGRATQTSSVVAAMQALCAPNCNAPRKSERCEIRCNSAPSRRGRPDGIGSSVGAIVIVRGAA